MNTKIRMLVGVSSSTDGLNLRYGEELELPEALAREYITCGWAESLDAPTSTIIEPRPRRKLERMPKRGGEGTDGDR
jgi:hypothetical protein